MNVADKRLTDLALEFKWPITDLLDWYRQDMADIVSLPLTEVRFIVLDYIQNHAACR